MLCGNLCYYCESLTIFWFVFWFLFKMIVRGNVFFLLSAGWKIHRYLFIPLLNRFDEHYWEKNKLATREAMNKDRKWISTCYIMFQKECFKWLIDRRGNLSTKPILKDRWSMLRYKRISQVSSECCIDKVNKTYFTGCLYTCKVSFGDFSFATPLLTNDRFVAVILDNRRSLDIGRKTEKKVLQRCQTYR